MRRLGSTGQALFALLLLAPTLVLLRSRVEWEYGFTTLIRFGEEFKPRWLTALHDIEPPTEAGSGYDGQFYAQFALDPLLRDPGLAKAIDAPAYRAARIGLPWLAAVLGGFAPSRVVQMYGALNLLFWFGLFVVLYRCIGFNTLKDRLLAICLLWNAGTLVSIDRALTDLPAAVLGLGALLWLERTKDNASQRQQAPAWMLMSAAILTKETTVLSMGIIGWPRTARQLLRAALIAAAIVMPLVLWRWYVGIQLPAMLRVSELGFPGHGLYQKLSYPLRMLGLCWNSEVLATVSVLAQAGYLLIKPRIDDPRWRMGAAFVVLSLFITQVVWVEQAAFARVLLPLSFAFNLLLQRYENGRRYMAWVVAGNAGALGGVLLSLCGHDVFYGLCLAVALFELWHHLGASTPSTDIGKPTPT